MKKLLLPFLICTILSAAAGDFEAERGSRVSWARLKYPVKGSSRHESDWDWHAHPTGDMRMIDFIRRNTTVNLKEDWNVVDVESLDKMCAFPFIFIHGQRTQNMSQAGKRNLREYLLRGGFVFVDDCVWQKKDPYQDVLYQSFLRLFKELFPEVRIQRADMKHPLFHCYFKIDVFPHCQGKNNGISLVTLNERLIDIITSSDIHCGWVTESWFGAQKTREAYRMGVNIYVYSMCF
jgi:hypothetical protein